MMLLRVLILPRYVPEESRLVALIPDKNILVISPYEDNDEFLNKIKRNGIPVDGELLLDKPLIVSHEGIGLLEW